MDLINPYIPGVIKFLASVALGIDSDLVDPHAKPEDKKVEDFVPAVGYDLKDRISAAKILIEYGLAKPPKVVAHANDAEDGDLVNGFEITFVKAKPKQDQEIKEPGRLN